jgi:hypothetical protein
VRRNLATLFLVLLFSSGGLVVAQTPTATINGLVLDPDAKSVPSAQIIVVNDLTGIQYETKTNNDGIYVVPNLPPGPYRVQVSKIGFKTLIKPDILLHLQDAIAINFTLPIGATSVVVTVEGGAPLIDTQGAAVSTVIDREFVGNLPLNGRSFNMLLQLTPGVVIAPSNPSSLGQFSVNGQRTDANNFLVDGVSANFGTAPNALASGQAGLGGVQAFSALGGTSSLVSVDDLQEFRIETSSFAAEFGRQPGGQVLLSTRSGTNDFHGGVFEYFRNNVFDANDWFANAAEIPTAPERHNDFGGFLGGRIWKDKTFFFFSYEGARLRLPQTSEFAVPSTSARASAPSSILPYLNAYPIPNGPILTDDGDTQLYTGSWSNTGTLNAASLRIDRVVNDRISLFARYNYAPSQLGTRGGFYTPNVFAATTSNVQTGTAGVSATLSNGISNALRFNYSTQGAGGSYSLDSFGGATPPASSALFSNMPPSQTFGYFQTYDTNSLGSGPNAANRTKQFNLTDATMVARGAHEVKFGIDYRDLYSDARPYHFQVETTQDTVADLISSGDALIVIYSQQPSRIRSQSLSLYGQDTWKVTQRLTLNYGLRWEWAPAPIGLGSTILTAWRNVNTPASIVVAPQGTPLWNTALGGFAPRAGLAYRLNAKGDLVLRAGWGMFYDLGSGAAAGLAYSWPNQQENAYYGPLPLADASPYLPPPASLNPPYYRTVNGFSPNLSLPRSYQWNVALEKAIGEKQVVSVTYVGQLGRDLLRVEDETTTGNPNFKPNSLFSLTDNGATSDYEALQLQYRRPLARGLQALANYTFSHSIDDASSDVAAFVGTTVVAFSNKLDRGNSDFDVRHSFSAALTYAIPSSRKPRLLSYVTRNWSLYGIAVARSGFPITVNQEVTCIQTICGIRPDVVPGQPFWLAQPSAPGGQILNVNAFALPAPGQQGNEGRNVVPGFSFVQTDVSTSRTFALGDRLNLQFRADAFNAFNHPNFTNPAGEYRGPSTPSFYLQSTQMLNQGLGGLNPLFQEGGPRSLQLSLRLTF